MSPRAVTDAFSQPKSAAKRHELVEILRKAKVVAGIRQGVAAGEDLKSLADIHAEAVEAEAEHSKSIPSPPKSVVEESAASSSAPTS